MEGVYVSLDRKAKCEALKKLADATDIMISVPEFNSYHNGYYWGIRVTFEYKDRVGDNLAAYDVVICARRLCRPMFLGTPTLSLIMKPGFLHRLW